MTVKENLRVKQNEGENAGIQVEAARKAKHERLSKSGIWMAAVAERDPRMQPVALTRNYADALADDDPQKAKLIELTRQLEELEDRSNVIQIVNRKIHKLFRHTGSAAGQRKRTT
ncbi:MAG: hypothetical protein IT342_24935 [Candidatus Melainabacteria bacterium]|nr:hypothetical protein [Candidatus Melainabacteria bacterium]